MILTLSFRRAPRERRSRSPRRRYWHVYWV